MMRRAEQIEEILRAIVRRAIPARDNQPGDAHQMVSIRAALLEQARVLLGEQATRATLLARPLCTSCGRRVRDVFASCDAHVVEERAAWRKNDGK